MAVIERIQTIEFMLSQWGIWAYHNRGLQIYFPSMEPFTRMLPREASGLCIDEGEGEAIDRLVGLLKQDSPREYDAIARHYVAGQSLRAIAKIYGWRGDHKRVAMLLNGGKRFIEGMLLGPHVHQARC